MGESRQFWDIRNKRCPHWVDFSRRTYSFRLVDGYDSVMKGTNLGSVVIANSSASSALYLVVTHKTSPEIHMPPHHKDALAEGRGIPAFG